MTYRVHKVTPSDVLGNPVGVTSGAQNTIIQGESATSPGTYVQVKAISDGGLAVNQNTVVDALNSTVVNLAAGATFTGAWVADLAWTAVQFAIKADQNCLVYVDQSRDGVNAIFTDTFEFVTSAPEGGAGHPVGLMSSYHRIRVKNIGLAATTVLDVQSVLVPFFATLPRSLDLKGNLRVASFGFTDASGFQANNTMHGEQLNAVIYRLAGSTFAHSAIDSNFWITNTGTGGTASSVNAELVVSTGTTANNSASVQSVLAARHVGGTTNKFHSSMRFPDLGASLNNTRRWGVYSATNGVFFEVLNGVFRLVTRFNSVDTAITNGSFNGDLGKSVSFTTSNTEFDIIYAADGVYFYIDSKLLHTARFPSGMWTGELSLPITFESINTGGNTTDISLICRHAVISRLGNPHTQPRKVFSQRVGVDVASNLKLGTGNLHGLILSGITNNSVVTLYDNTTATGTGTVIWASGPLTANGLPFYLDFKGIPFSVGLSVGITGANLNVLTMYE